MVIDSSIIMFFLLVVTNAGWIAALSMTSSASPVPTIAKPTKVVVAGASSSVGYFTFKKLLMRKNQFYPIGLVRDSRGYNALKKLGADDNQIKICDITIKESLIGIFDGVNKVVICTSAEPLFKLRYKVLNFLRGLIRKSRLPKTSEFYYAKAQRPYEVDYLGQKNIIDECMKARVEHVVLLGNMGGGVDEVNLFCIRCYPTTPLNDDSLLGYRGSRLNDVGRKKDDPDMKNGNILKWKRAAERYLMKRCFFTILHAAQLSDEKGGRREVIWDTDDALLRTDYRKIPKQDVAEVIMQALIWPEAIGRSIDIASLPESQSGNKPDGPPNDWLRFWSRPGNCVYPADFDDLKFK